MELTLAYDAILRLWPTEAPDAQGNTPDDIPDMRVILPAQGRTTGAAFIVSPGGSYLHQAYHEGVPVGEWLAAHGITAFVLHYRCGPRYRHPAPLSDAQRAVRIVRTFAPTWGLDPERIGMLGFSAGGHLTSMVATHPDNGDEQASDPIKRAPSHLNLHILVYAVITRGHRCWANILGDHPSEELLTEFCSEQHVTAQTPPAFLAHSTKDPGVPPSHSDVYAASLQAHGVPYEYVRCDMGGHGFGLHEGWTEPCIRWLQAQEWAQSQS